MKLIFIFFPFFILAQQTKKPDTVFCDCATAKIITLKGSVKVGPTLAPLGNGQASEISERLQKTKFAFEKEHNSAWYKLIITTSGFLVFDIIPTKPEDDYDFMLFKGSNAGFCDSLHKFHIQPLRACISRDKEEIKGLTGLSFKAKKELIKEGLGDAYAKPIEVKSGEVYYLVLDNVYKEGGGHTINFYFEELMALKGIVNDENKKPVKADITITAPNGDTLKKLQSDAKGNFDFEVVLRKNLHYTLNFYNDSSFFATKEISTKTNKDTLKNLTTVLPTLKKGNKYVIQNINFYPGSATVLPYAFSSLKSLSKLMQKNKTLKILIVGHTNGNNSLTKSLSMNRAAMIKKFLEVNAIAADRITTDGKGGTEMLYPAGESAPEWQQVLNRRVEIFVLEK